MVDRTHFNLIFEQLKQILQPYESKLVLEADTPDNYSLNTPYSEKFRKEVFFGAVQIKKNYVSFHLMPVYMFPDLLETLSPPLRKRMQGKSCFNFSKADGPLFEELAALTQRSVERVRREQVL